jgi:hypothetical protein
MRGRGGGAFYIIFSCLWYVQGTELYLFSLSKVLHFFGADKEAYLNLTNINREDHRDNLRSILGYENAKNYPHREYVQNKHVWYLDQVQKICISTRTFYDKMHKITLDT